MTHSENLNDKIAEWVSDITIKQNVSFYIIDERSNPNVHWDIHKITSSHIQFNIYIIYILSKRYAVKDTP